MGMGKSAIFDIYKKNMRNFAGFLTFLFLVNLGFMVLGRERVSAAFVPTLSVSAWRPEVKVKGSDVLKTENKTTETSVWFQIQTNNRTGYTASFSTDTDNTDLVNLASSTNAKISSVKSNFALADLPVNTWGYKLDSGNYAPIPSLSNPVNFFQTAERNLEAKYKGIFFGLKLGNDLEGGSYENKVIFSVVTNPYEKKALMVKGNSIQSYLRNFNENGAKTKRFKRSTNLPEHLENVKNIEDADSDYEIKLWYDVATETAYYYSEAEKIFLNENCNSMFADDMFNNYKLSNLEEIEFSGLDTSKVKNMGHMFSYLKNIKQLDLSSFNTSNVTNMWGMFWGSEKLTNLDISNFNTKKVEHMDEMFSRLSTIEQLNLSSFDTSNVTNMKRMFAESNRITSLELSSFDTGNVKDMSGMFYGMTALTNLNISNFNTQNVTNMSEMFANLANITSLNLSNFNTPKVTNMQGMFRYSRFNELNISNFNTQSVTDMSEMFAYMPKVVSLNLSNFDTSEVVNMSSMFLSMENLTSLNLSSFNTRKVKNMKSMFQSCKKITELNLSSFRTENVENMNSMFFNMMELSELNIENFDTRNVTDMNKMFCYTNLSRVNVSNFDTSKVKDMSYMFNNMRKLTELDLSNFNTKEVTSMFAMFYNTTNLVSLDISNFNTEKVTILSHMFSLEGDQIGSDKLEKIYVNNDFSTSKLESSNNVFTNRKKLRGGNGSFLADPSTADLTWLRVDRPGVQGYFTRKP